MRGAQGQSRPNNDHTMQEGIVRLIKTGFTSVLTLSLGWAGFERGPRQSHRPNRQSTAGHGSPDVQISCCSAPTHETGGAILPVGRY